MKKLAVLALLTLCVALFQATVNIGSVVSRDTGVDKNRVVIDVSGKTTYSVEPSSGGTVHRIVIPNAGSLGTKPEYKRLSPVIERISTYKDGNNAVVEIRTMEAVNLSHSMQNGRIVLNLSKAGSSPVLSPRESVPKPVILPPSDPIPPTRYYDSPQEIATIKVKPSQKKPVIKPLPPPEKPKADSILPAPEVKQLFPSTAEVDSLLPPQALDDEMPVQAVAKADFMSFVKKNWIWLAGALLLALIAIIVLAGKKKTSKPDDLKGTTLVLDGETKSRLVMKLHKENWKASEIARELNLPLKEVEQVISQATRNSDTTGQN
jgi:hypothetical protein